MQIIDRLPDNCSKNYPRVQKTENVHEQFRHRIESTWNRNGKVPRPVHSLLSSFPPPSRPLFAIKLGQMFRIHKKRVFQKILPSQIS